MIALLIAVVILAFVGWLLIQIPMPPQIKNVVIGVVILIVVLMVINAVWPGAIHLPR